LPLLDRPGWPLVLGWPLLGWPLLGWPLLFDGPLLLLGWPLLG
jgi:hypothetical protein